MLANAIGDTNTSTACAGALVCRCVVQAAQSMQLPHQLVVQHGASTCCVSATCTAVVHMNYLSLCAVSFVEALAAFQTEVPPGAALGCCLADKGCLEVLKGTLRYYAASQRVGWPPSRCQVGGSVFLFFTCELPAVAVAVALEHLLCAHQLVCVGQDVLLIWESSHTYGCAIGVCGCVNQLGCPMNEAALPAEWCVCVCKQAPQWCCSLLPRSAKKRRGAVFCVYISHVGCSLLHPVRAGCAAGHLQCSGSQVLAGKLWWWWFAVCVCVCLVGVHL